MSEWKIIKTQEDADALFYEFGGFHDGCLKEMNYISGASVSKDLWMYPRDNEGRVTVIFQRQFRSPSVIEMEFSQLERLHIAPAGEGYTCEILDAYLGIYNGLVFWADGDDFDPSKSEKYDDRTWISARCAKWREADEYIGDKAVYVKRED